MKPLRSFSLFASLALLLFSCGCLTGPGEYTPADLQADVDAAAGLTASLRLAGHPERRGPWESAETGLSNLAAHEEWSVSAFAEAFAVSGADKIESEKIRLWVESGTVAIATAAGRRVDLKDPVWARAAILGAQSGIARALKSTAQK